MTKFYSTRDSAVAVLRKAGIAKADYAKHLTTQVVDGKTSYGANLTPKPEVEEVNDVAAMIAAAKARNAANVAKLAPAPMSDMAKALTAEKKEAKPNGKMPKMQAEKKAPKAAPKPKVEKDDDSVRNVGVSDWIRGLIKAGKTNKEILDASEKAGFDLSGKKRYFPAFYRFDMKRKNQL